MTDPSPPRPIVIPSALDPSKDYHGAAIAAALPARDGLSVPLPDLTYVFIVFANRSGSTLLGALLAATGYFNAAEEALNADTVIARCRERGLSSFARYFAQTAAEQARNRHFVVKASIGQLAVLGGHGILGRILPRARFILVERQDKLGQAISWLVAAHTGEFTSFHPRQDRPPPSYSRDALVRVMADVAQDQALTSLFMGLNGIVPLHLSYEFFSVRCQDAVRLVCDHVGAHAPDYDPSRLHLRRQATALNDAWRARFLAGQ